MRAPAISAQLLASVLLALSGCGTNSPGGPGPAGDVGRAGVRSSSYGAVPYPDPQGWQGYIEYMSGAFPGSTPSALWIVGTVDESIEGINLEFPTPDSLVYPHVSFSDEDMHEEYLAWFDQCGIEVFLQVEPGYAEVGTLIDIVMQQYGDHPCVAGFGVDVEWYGNVTEGQPGTPVTDSAAAAWETHLQNHDEDHRLYLKHWDPAWMPPGYRGGIIFVDDGQGYADMSAFLADMQAWAEAFPSSVVFYQYGYDSDRPWWETLESPPLTIGQALADQTPQECGLFWVDFNLSEIPQP